MIDKNRLIEEYSLKSFGQKGWMNSENNLLCPICNKGDKFGVLFVGDSGIVKCFHENHYTTSLYNYLVEIDRGDLIEKKSVSVDRKISILNIGKEECVCLEIPEVKLPMGFVEVESDDYLDSRNWDTGHYELFKPGVSKIDPRLRKHHIILQIFQKGVVTGWMARSRKSKEWHKQDKDIAKEEERRPVLRYIN